MNARIKKLRIIQSILLILGFLIIFFTYLDREKKTNEKILTKENQELVKKQIESKSQDGEVFFNIEYSGLDLAGNRYILKSKKASNKKENQKIVNMESVEAIFYFKDNTVLKVLSDKGVYNNETLDMVFNKNVKANYEGSELLAQKAEYSNSKSFLIISEKVKITDIRGTMVADELLFDIKNKTLNIASYDDKKINTNINIKWKKVLEF